jgi:hypothetical protein
MNGCLVIRKLLGASESKGELLTKLPKRAKAPYSATGL